jgi:prolyl-tRNA synthetase
MSVAPYHVDVVCVNKDDETQMAVAERIHDELEKLGVEVVLDDRKERPGVKFKDADLIGFPIRITVGKKAGESVVEYKLRRGGDVVEMSVEDAIENAKTLVFDEK